LYAQASSVCLLLDPCVAASFAGYEGLILLLPFEHLGSASVQISQSEGMVAGAGTLKAILLLV